MKITTETLEEMGACAEQVMLFGRLYPNGVNLPDSDPERQAVLDAAVLGELDVVWWLKRTGTSGAVRKWDKAGGLVEERHYRGGLLNDPDDGTPAVRQWDKGGYPVEERHYWRGLLNDPDDGSPALRDWDNGVLYRELHYKDGKERKATNENHN